MMTSDIIHRLWYHYRITVLQTSTVALADSFMNQTFRLCTIRQSSVAMTHTHVHKTVG